MRLILFDLDGTLIDSAAVILASQAGTFEAHGLPVPSRERMLSVVGLTLPQAFKAHVGEDGPFEAMAASYREIYHTIRHQPEYHEALFPGARATIEVLSARKDALIGIATGKGTRGVTAILEREGWQDRFVTVQTADTAASKPEPDMIVNAARESGVSAERIWMVGDSVHDMAMAKAAGARGAAVAWGFMPVDALQAAGAEVVIEEFATIPTLLAM